MTDTAIPQITLNDGNVLPAVGFGTCYLNGREGVKAIVSAIHNGYRLLDTAFRYENEGAVGAAVHCCGVPREELLVSSKLPGRHHKYEAALTCIEESLYRAGLDYYDMYLIHWPNPNIGLYVEAWQALIEARKRGYVRTIGVCNFLPAYLEKLEAETGVLPAVNQIEMHPYFAQPEQHAYNKAHGILTQAWSPLGRGSNMLQAPELGQIAERLGRSISQVILRWHFQQGAQPLPKSSKSERQRENLAIFDFELTDADMKAISALTRPDGRTTNQDPLTHEEL